jgi:hypothetical protein
MNPLVFVWRLLRVWRWWFLQFKHHVLRLQYMIRNIGVGQSSFQAKDHTPARQAKGQAVLGITIGGIKFSSILGTR